MKYCSGCKKEHPRTAFYKNKCKPDGLRYQCKVCGSKKAKERRKNMTPEQRKRARDASGKWQKNNPEKRRASERKYRENNREKRRASQKKYQQKPEAKKKRNELHRKRKREDPAFKILSNIRRHMYMVLKGKSKSAHTMKLLGCSTEHLLSHIEEQFQHGMSWNNKGKWEMDHIVPCNHFDHSNPEHQRQCWHYTNFQPLWKRDNRSKRSKRVYNRAWNGSMWIYQYIPIEYEDSTSGTGSKSVPL